MNNNGYFINPAQLTAQARIREQQQQVRMQALGQQYQGMMLPPSNIPRPSIPPMRPPSRATPDRLYQPQSQPPMRPHTPQHPTPAASPPLPGSPYLNTKPKLASPGPVGVVRPPSSSGMGMINMAMMGMNVNMAMGVASQVPQMPMSTPMQMQPPMHPHPHAHPQVHQHQRQPSLPRQQSVPVSIKAESVPPPDRASSVGTPVPALDGQGELERSSVPLGLGSVTPVPALVSATATTPATIPTTTSIPGPGQGALVANASIPPSTPTPNPTPTQARPSSSSSSSQSTLAPPPPLPPTLHLNPSTTHTTLVPLLTSLSSIPALAPAEIESIQEWMGADREYEGRYRAMKERMREEGVALGWGGGLGSRGRGWWEKGWGQGQGQEAGNGNRWRRGREPFDVRYPKRREGKRRGKREGLRLPRKLDIKDVNKPEQLVPIRLEFDVEHHKMRETFVWNLNDPVVTPEHFAQSLIEDYALAPTYHSMIAKAIHDQLSDFKAHSGPGFASGVFDVDSGGGDDGHGQQGQGQAVVSPTVVDPRNPSDVRTGSGEDVGEGGNGENESEPVRGRLDQDDDAWWAGWRERVGAGAGVFARARARSRRRSKSKTKSTGRARKRRRVVKLEPGDGDADAVDGDVEDAGEGDGEDNGDGEDAGDGDGEALWTKSVRLDEMEVDEAKMREEMRVLIKLDIIVGSMRLEDQFEWDIENEMVLPEDFAEVYAMDLGLGGEFRTAIAHCIREQIHAYQKSLFLIGHPHPSDGSQILDEDLRSSFLPSLHTAARPIDQVSSYTPILNYLSDGEIDRNEKERDKEMTRRNKRNRNTRSRRGVGLGGVGVVMPDRDPVRTYRTPAIGFPEVDPQVLALAQAAQAPTSRRAAAAAASLTIANMVASENGTAVMPPMPIPAVPATPVHGHGHHGQQQIGGQQVPRKSKGGVKGYFKPPAYPSEVLGPRANVGAPTVSTGVDVATLPEPLENDPPPPPEFSVVATISSGVGTGAGAGSGAGEGGRANFGGAGAGAGGVPRAMTAKRAKELEREAKEKEFADGQHPNMINGVWHCSNCGCPDSIAIGRRKGPLGDKSQCGVCGKYWHRHRRPRPVEYNPDPDFHSGLKRDIEQSKIIASAKKKGAAAALRAQNNSSTQPHTPAETSEAQTPARSQDFDMSVSVSARQSPASAPPGAGAGGEDRDRAVSPVSTASSASEAPLAQRAKTNGIRRITSPPLESSPVKRERDRDRDRDRDQSPRQSKTPLPVSQDGAKPQGQGVQPAPISPVKPTMEAPSWLTSAKAAMMARYPNDKFETILRKVNASTSPEWRIKCLDCPGKLYTPGPGETLSNYEVHLKNRQHRQRVNERMNNEGES